MRSGRFGWCGSWSRGRCSGCWVVEEVPDDDQDGAGDGDEGSLFASPADQAPVTLAEERVGLGCCGGDLAEDTFEVAVPFAGFADLGFRAGLDGLGRQLGPGHQVRGSGEATHVETDLGDDDLRCSFGDPGYLVEALHGAETAGVGVVVDWYVADGPRGMVGWWGGFGELGDELLDASGEPVDLLGAGVDLVQQELGQVCVVIIEAAVERFEQRCPFGVELPSSQVGERLRVALAGDERFDHRSGRHPEEVCCDRRQLDQRVLKELLEALLVSRSFLD